MYIEARTDQILLADPSQARGAARKTATTEWKAKGKDPRSRELVAARDHPDLQARAEQLATAYEVELKQFYDAMEVRAASLAEDGDEAAGEDDQHRAESTASPNNGGGGE